MCELNVNQFIDTLVKTERPTSVDPTYQWIKKLEKVNENSFTVINAKGESKEVLLKDLKMKQPPRSSLKDASGTDREK